MSSRFDSVLGIHADALKLREARGRILASNLANADTPNYKAQDLDFRAAMLKQRGDDMSLRSTSMSKQYK